jgi:uncharacterized protein YjiS (DUF1127 family)
MTIGTISSPVTQPTERRQARIASVWRAAGGFLMAWSWRSRSRQSLAELTDDQLRDIGLSAYEARQEARRSIMVLLDGAGLPPL